MKAVIITLALGILAACSPNVTEQIQTKPSSQKKQIQQTAPLDFSQIKVSQVLGHWETGAGCATYLHLKSDGTGTFQSMSGEQDFNWTFDIKTGLTEVPLVFKEWEGKENKLVQVSRNHLLKLRLDPLQNELCPVDSKGNVYRRSRFQTE